MTLTDWIWIFVIGGIVFVFSLILGADVLQAICTALVGIVIVVLSELWEKRP